MATARFLLTLGLAAALGAAILSFLSRRPRSGPGGLGLAFVTGALGLGLWTHLLLLIRIPVNLPAVLSGPAVLLALGRFRFLRGLVWRRPPWPAALLVPAAVFLLWGALADRELGYDPDTMYLFRAKSIVRHGTFWNEDFTDPARLHLGHRRPLLLPAMYADVALLCGSWEGRLLRTWFALLQVAAWAAMYDVLRGRTGRLPAALGTALFAWVPAFWHDHGGAVAAYADPPLSMAFLLALASETPLSVFFLCAGVLLKDEGMAFLLPCAAVRGWRPAALPAGLAAAWVLCALHLPRDADFLPANFLNPHGSEIPAVLRQIGSEMVTLKHWSLLWVLVLLVLAARGRRLGREDALWLLPVAAQLAIYTAVWITFEPKAMALFLRVQDMRLLMHVAPIAWCWAVIRAADAAGNGEAAVRVPAS